MIEIIAYYSLASNVFHLEGLSKNLQKQIRGGAPTRRNKHNVVASILIGQLGRNEKAKSYFSSNALFLELFKSINEINLLVGTRIIYLECRDIEKLKDLYISRGFKLLTDNKGNPIINDSNNVKLITFVMSMKNLKQILKDNKITNV